MVFITFMESVPGRVLRAAVGVALLWAGAGTAPFAGFALMTIGLVFVLTAAADVCPAAGVHDLFLRAMGHRRGTADHRR